MLGFFELIIVFIFVLIGLTCYWYLSMPRNAPPGPLGLPFVGYLVRHGDPLTHFKELAAKYGSVFSYYAGSNLVVVIGGNTGIKDLIVKEGDSFTDRWNSPLVLKENPRVLGLLGSKGALWKEQRRFALATLRDFGLGKPILEGFIHEEVEKLCQRLDTLLGQQLDLKFYLNAAVSNVICELTFGDRYDYDDTAFFDVLDQLNLRVASATVTVSYAYQPWMWLLPKFRSNRAAMIKTGQALGKYLMDIINKHKQTYDYGEPTNYVDAFLKQQRDGSGQFFDDEQLIWAVISLFSAGTETTSTTLRWGILFCCLHPDVQEKVHQEIAGIVGMSSFPSMNDRSKLNYTEAVLLETQRIASLVPIFGRQAVREVKYNGFRIPAGTAIIVNTSSVHNDDNLYPEPELFRPERFLDDGKIKRDDYMMPFGAGKRICLGESLARMELFLFFAALLQRYKFSFVPGEPKPIVRHILGITSQPVPYNVILTARA